MSKLRKVESNESDKLKAVSAVNKKAANGSDIDLSVFTNPEKELPYQSDPSTLPKQDHAPEHNQENK